jgi:hypothetical protein
MSLSDLIRRGVAANTANAKAANPANDGAFEAPTYSGLAKLAELALATSVSECGEEWREFESLLAIVAPAYNTPAHELDEIREAARRDIASALIAYRPMAKEIRTFGK